MRQILEISNDPKQKFTLITDDNLAFDFKLEYSDQQGGWYFSLTYGILTINRSRLVTDPNILRQYKNVLPFGIGVMSDDGTEPFLIDDLSTSRVNLYILDQSEVQSLEQDFYNE